ncbi:MAG: D-2-hydroxyacid dehydrogenase [Lachnospiraceae bacterium]|nr:D-2-hydroxyacid dehydrogenase [Lachnospiraceae bacterium]
MKIVILDAITLTLDNDMDFSVLEQYGDLQIYDFTRDEQVAERIKDADVVLCNKTPMSQDNLKDAKNLKYIGLFATGYNNIDLEYTNERNITVCNAADYSTESVTQHVFALILELYNRVGVYNEFVQNQGWMNTDRFSPFLDMQELFGKTIGIIGYGSIGRNVAKIAGAFGMNVVAYSRSLQKSGEGMQRMEIDELLKVSDIVTMHCPLNKDSENMCNRDFFGKMKKDAIFINTSRGGIVEEDALVEALNSGSIKAAAVDVIYKEPMEKDSPLLGVKNLIITPHVAWAPLETRTRLFGIVAGNLKNWMDGNPTNVVH